MADIREQILLDNMGARLFRSPAWSSIGVKAKLALRRFVVATSATPLRPLYDLVYRAHVWYGVRTMRKLPGVRAIYVTRGVASGEIVPGISDVDFAVFGDWTDEEHDQVSTALRRLSATSPLYERELWREARTVSSIQALYDSDFLLMCRLDEGRIRWSLRFGEDVLAGLPPPRADRVAGGYYMDLRLWWSYFTRTAFDTGVLATDPSFRNSLCYKVVAESIAKVRALAGHPVEPVRRKAFAERLRISSGPERRYLERLRHCGERPDRAFDGDVHQDTWGFLLPMLEDVHEALGATPSFAPIPSASPLRVDAPVGELLRAPQTLEHVSRLVAHAKTAWAGYRSSFLVPCLSFYAPDDLVLLIETEPAQPPRVDEIRELIRLHTSPTAALNQRVTIFVLLSQGAYQIEVAGPLDLWHLLMCPASNADVFDLVTRPEHAFDGPPRRASAAPVWTRFASALVDEEIGVRESAMAKASAATRSAMSSLDLLRNIWRHLQLQAVGVSTRIGHPVIPLTLGAIQRVLAPLQLIDAELLMRLQLAYERALNGEPVDIGPEMDQLMRTLAARSR